MARRRIPSTVFLLALFLILISLFSIGHQSKTSNTAKGIDVSEWQHELDFNLLRKHDDIHYALLRCSVGVEDVEDQMFERHYHNAKKAKLDVGVYHYSHATTKEEALKEAKTTLRMVKGKTIDLPIFYDIETDRQDHLSPKELTDLILVYLEEIEKHGYTAGIYANLHWVNERLEMDRLSDYPLWIANYSDTLHYDGDYDYWQYTQEGKLTDYPGHFDFNMKKA